LTARVDLKMVDGLVVESMKISVGSIIVFWDIAGRRYEGKILDVSNEFLKYFDSHKDCERFIKLNLISEAEMKELK